MARAATPAIAALVAAGAPHAVVQYPHDPRAESFGEEAVAALADAGVRFTNTRSQAPWTLPSFSSTLTSLYPSAHGAGRGGHDEWEPIDPNTLSLAEVLTRNGWETAGIVANGLISPRYGLDQGYAMYRAAWAMESLKVSAGASTAAAESVEK